MDLALRVSIAPAPRRGDHNAVLPLLDPRGADVILGTLPTGDAMTSPVVPGARSMFGPRGACVAHDGSLWVADTGHHRLLGWRTMPARDGEPAEILIGQAGFDCEGRNGKHAVGPATLNVPTGVAACGEGLAVADAWNHRVLIWRSVPTRHDQPADVVLGQSDFASGELNRGPSSNMGPRADTLYWPFGVHWDGQSLWVADTGNRRVLRWRGMPSANGQPADLVLGQVGFESRDENAGGTPTASSMRWPHGIATRGGLLCVADAGNNRIMLWREMPAATGQPCDVLLGQADPRAVDHNRGDYWPGAGSLNMPYAVAILGRWLLVADTASSRMVGWDLERMPATGVPAQRLAGQHDWESKGDNRWKPATRDSLCWPYGLCASGDCIVIADAGNNRVLRWRLAGDCHE